MIQIENGTVEVVQPTSRINKLMRLSRADKYFIEDIIQHQKNRLDDSNWLGSDGWVRKRFEEYFMRLCAVSMLPDVLHPKSDSNLSLDLIGTSSGSIDAFVS